jgi:hypothetical protein
MVDLVGSPMRQPVIDARSAYTVPGVVASEEFAVMCQEEVLLVLDKHSLSFVCVCVISNCTTRPSMPLAQSLCWPSFDLIRKTFIVKGRKR